MDPIAAMWEDLVVEATGRVDKHDFFKYLPNLCAPGPRAPPTTPSPASKHSTVQVHIWDRTMLELEVENPTAMDQGEKARKKVILFSGNDYLNLSTHPVVRKAAAKGCTVTRLPPTFRYLPASGQRLV